MMKLINVIIVDDEWLARKRLEKLLEHYPHCRVIGNCRNGQEAISQINLKAPDLVFLDIQMPDMDGFKVIEALLPEKMPHIVFTTAFDHYAIKAFEVKALDYLLKPFDEAQMDRAVQRVQQKMDLSKTADLHHQLLSWVRQYQESDKGYCYHLEIKQRGSILSIGTDEIYYFKSDGNYILAFTANRKYLYRSTLNGLLEKLSPKEFLRIHRSYAINIRFIASCQYQNNNEYKFLLKNGVSLLSGKSFKSAISTFLAQQQF